MINGKARKNLLISTETKKHLTTVYILCVCSDKECLIAFPWNLTPSVFASFRMSQGITDKYRGTRCT
jgi:hypothetical protein